VHLRDKRVQAADARDVQVGVQLLQVVNAAMLLCGLCHTTRVELFYHVDQVIAEALLDVLVWRGAPRVILLRGAQL